VYHRAVGGVVSSEAVIGSGGDERLRESLDLDCLPDLEARFR
jgi:hypothetical protein